MSDAADAVREQAEFAHAFGTRVLQGYLSGFEGDAWLAQPFEGANHALWQVGHLAYAHHALGGMMGAEMGELPDGYAELFGMGSEPVADGARYPDPQRVLDQMWQMRERFIAGVRALPDERMHETLSDDGFLRTPAQIIAFVPIHDATHAGQIAVLRKHLGLPRVLA